MRRTWYEQGTWCVRGTCYARGTCYVRGTWYARGAGYGYRTWRARRMGGVRAWAWYVYVRGARYGGRGAGRTPVFANQGASRRARVREGRLAPVRDRCGARGRQFASRPRGAGHGDDLTQVVLGERGTGTTLRQSSSGSGARGRPYASRPRGAGHGDDLTQVVLRERGTGTTLRKSSSGSRSVHLLRVFATRTLTGGHPHTSQCTCCGFLQPVH